jgi:hypothetical protein
MTLIPLQSSSSELTSFFFFFPPLPFGSVPPSAASRCFHPLRGPGLRRTGAVAEAEAGDPEAEPVAVRLLAFLGGGDSDLGGGDISGESSR